MNSNNGFNARTATIEDLAASGIVDPTNVVFNSARNAISTAATVLTVGVITLLPRQESTGQPSVPAL